MEEKKLEKLLRCLVTRAYFFIHFLSIPKKEEIWLRHHWNCFFLNWKESTHPSFADDEKCVTSRSLPDDVVALIVETLFKEEISFDKSKMNGGNMEERNQTTTSDHHNNNSISIRNPSRIREKFDLRSSIEFNLPASDEKIASQCYPIFTCQN